MSPSLKKLIKNLVGDDDITNKSMSKVFWVDNKICQGEFPRNPTQCIGKVRCRCEMWCRLRDVVSFSRCDVVFEV